MAVFRISSGRAVAVVLLATAFARPAKSAETFNLAEDAAAGRTWSVSADVTADGTFEFQAGPGSEKPTTHPVKLAATYRYAERRLPAAGRDADAYRAVRIYQTAESSVTVGGQASSMLLRPDRRKVVVRATRNGPDPFGLDGPLTSTEVELLPYPGDPLLLAALLPTSPVEVGQTWSPDPWVPAALAGLDAATEAKLTCRLEGVREKIATITFEGRVEGAARGATAETTFDGTLTFDTAAAALTAAELAQTERRSIGPLAPGMRLTLKATLRRSPTAAPIPDAVAAAVPAVPSADALRTEYRAPWGASLLFDRDWKQFHQTAQVLILRLLDDGSLVAQCNLSPVRGGKPGEPVDDRQFEADIRKSLGERLKEVTAIEELKTPEGLHFVRIRATGTVENTPRLWRYYLATAPDGRQAAFVVTFEPHNAERARRPRRPPRDGPSLRRRRTAERRAVGPAMPAASRFRSRMRIPRRTRPAGPDVSDDSPAGRRGQIVLPAFPGELSFASGSEARRGRR